MNDKAAFSLCGLMLLWCAVIGWTFGLHAEEPSPISAEEMAQLIKSLNHADYAVRQAATKQLSQVGPEALAPLQEALKSDSLEVRMRVITLLGAIYRRADESTFEPTEQVLDRVRNEESGSLSEQAQTALDACQEQRQKDALEKIRKLGGSILYEQKNGIPGVEVVEEDESEDEAPGPPAINSIVIGREWTGGDAGLRQIQRLSQLRVVYRVHDAPVTDDGIAALTEAMPQPFSVESRGAAYFGINPVTNFNRPGCVIGRVTPDSAAAKAGLQPNDLLTHFDGQEVISSEQLIKLIATKLPGDEVPVSVIRNGEVMEFKPKLTGWPREMPRK